MFKNKFHQSFPFAPWERRYQRAKKFLLVSNYRATRMGWWTRRQPNQQMAKLEIALLCFQSCLINPFPVYSGYRCVLIRLANLFVISHPLTFSMTGSAGVYIRIFKSRTQTLKFISAPCKLWNEKITIFASDRIWHSGRKRVLAHLAVQLSRASWFIHGVNRMRKF